MAQVTSLTAERSLELAGEAIIGASLSGYNLILERRNGGTIDVGNIRGPAGPTGGISAGQLSDAITASENAAGRGVIAHDDSTVDDPLGATADAWYTLAGITTTFTPIPGRVYSIEWYAMLIALDTDLSHFDLELLDGGDPIGRASVFSPNNGRGCGVNGRLNKLAPGGWNTAKTLTLRARCSQDGDTEVQNSYQAGYITVIDHGTI